MEGDPSAALLKELKSLFKCNDCEEEKQKQINFILDKINSVHTENIQLSPVLEECLIVLTSLLDPAKNNHLLSKLCHLIQNISKAKKKPEDRDIDQDFLSEDTLKYLLDYFLLALSVSQEWVLTDIVTALSCILFENVGRLEKYWDHLVGPSGVLIRIYETSHGKPDKHSSILRCLQNLCFQKDNHSPYLNEVHVVTCFTTFLDALQQGLKNDSVFNDPYQLNILLCALYGLKNLLVARQQIPGIHLGELLGILKALISFGLKDKSSLIYSCLFPAPVHHVEDCLNTTLSAKNAPNLGKKTFSHKKRSQKKEGGDKRSFESSKNDSLIQNDSACPESKPSSFSNPSWMYNSSSESEFSDSESSFAAKIRFRQCKIRQCSYRVLQAVNLATEKKVFFSYWSYFLSDASGQGLTVVDSILKDPANQVQLSALSFLTDILDGSKLYLAVANERQQATTSFIPISSTYAAIVRDIHKCLLSALLNDAMPSSTVQILKCYTVLVDNVSYHRLNPDLLLNLVKELDKFINDKDIDTQVSSLCLLRSIVRTPLIQNDLKEAFIKRKSLEDSPSCWLIETSKRFLAPEFGYRKMSIPVVVEILQALTAFVQNFYSLIRIFFLDLKEIIAISIADLDISIQFRGLKVFDVLGKGFLEEWGQKDKNDPEYKEFLKLNYEMWMAFLQYSFPPFLQDPTPLSIRVLCCDCLSNIGDDIFQLLPRHIRVMYVTTLLGLVKDENASLRGSVIRCLGIYAMLPSMQETYTFLMDIGEAVVTLLEDKNLNTSFKASWALGNLTDALLAKRSELLDVIPNDFICSLGIAALNASKGQDKVKLRANMVRAFGNLLSYIPETFLGDENVKLFVTESVNLLKNCLIKSSMKVQWNACYAIGRMIQNKHLIQSGLVSTEDILRTLIETVRSSNNFKVQINATSTLTLLPERSFYGNQFWDLWLCLLELLNVVQQSVDFKEIQHQQGLCQQVFIGLVRMSSLLELNDLVMVSEQTISASDHLTLMLEKVINTLSIEKIGECKEAKQNLEGLYNLAKEQNYEKYILECCLIMISVYSKITWRVN